MKTKKKPAKKSGLVVSPVTTTIHPAVHEYIKWRRQVYGEQLSQVISSVYLERMESDERYKKHLAEQEG